LVARLRSQASRPRLDRRVTQAIRRDRLAGSGDRVAVALSGGSDSVALAWLLHDLAPRATWRLAGLIHVHHGLRGADADADEQFCRDLAARLGLPIDVTHADVAARARARRQSLESAARDARYEAFEQAAGRLDATVVMTGHTADDQAETVLLRLLRGTGLRGVSAIRARRGRYRRPLLDIRRVELREDLALRGESFREDASNTDVTIARNRVRRDLMPVLEAVAPGGVRALGRFARLAADDEAFLRRAARTAGEAAVDGVQLNAGAIAALPVPLGRRVVRRALEDAGGVPTFAHVESMLRLARSDKPSGHLDMSGVRADRLGPVLKLSRPGAGPETTTFAHVLPVPGAVAIPETSVTIRASYQKSATRETMTRSGPGLAVLQATSMVPPLTVRSRRAGDRFQPLGAPGSRKVQDLFVDRKVPRAARDRVPVVVDATGRIVWVAGVALAEACRVTAPEAGVVILELREGHQ